MAAVKGLVVLVTKVLRVLVARGHLKCICTNKYPSNKA